MNIISMTMRIFSFVFFTGFFSRHFSQTTYECLASVPCGCSENSAILTRIVGGENAVSQTWGWAASIRYSTTNAHFCGGSIISASHILTAAHCAERITSTSSVYVVVGSIFLNTINQQRTIQSVKIHPNYSSVDLINDIAILKLSSPLNLNASGVDLICLPNVSTTILTWKEYPPVNSTLVAIGWGVLSEGSVVVSSILQQVTVYAIEATSNYCQSVSIGDSSTRFCAGVMPQGGKDTCQGDSGGPLMLFTSDRVWEQVGITSSGIGCAQRNYPGIYTRVAAYQTWINDILNRTPSNYNFSYTLVFFLFLSTFF